MLTIGLGPAFAGGGGGGIPKVYDLGLPYTSTLKFGTSITEISKCDMSMISDKSNMFNNCSKLSIIPLLDLEGTTSSSSMFGYCSRLKRIDVCNVDSITNANSMFIRCSVLEEVCELNLVNCTGMGQMFREAGITTIPYLNMSSCTSASSMFYKCEDLVTANLFGLKTALELKYSPLLSKESVIYLFENAQTVTTTQTITLHADVFSQLTEDEIAIATEKGFSVVSA